MRLFLLIGFILVTLTSCQSDGKTARSIDMYNASGDMIGTAALTEEPDGIKIKLKLEGLAPGYHGIHVHEYAICEGPDFKTAGNHLDPEGKEHGLMNPKGAHLGDLPNVEADSGGLVTADLMLAGATLKDGKMSVLRGEGTSLVIDEKTDDGLSQPSGNSGMRIACGAIKANPNAEVKKDSPTDPTKFNEKQKGE